MDMDESAPLPNPAIIELGGTFVFFQMFYVGQEECKPPCVLHELLLFVCLSICSRVVLRSLELPPANLAAAAKAGAVASAKGATLAGAKPTGAANSLLFVVCQCAHEIMQQIRVLVLVACRSQS